MLQFLIALAALFAAIVFYREVKWCLFILRAKIWYVKMNMINKLSEIRFKKFVILMRIRLFWYALEHEWARIWFLAHGKGDIGHHPKFCKK